MKRTLNFTAFAALGVLAMTLFIPPTAFAENRQAEMLKKVSIEQRLGEQVPLNLEFQDEAGNAVQLSRYFGKKPVLMMPVYFKCPMLCGMVTRGVMTALRAMKNFSAGNEFEIITFSIDSREGVELAAKAKSEYIHEYSRPGAETGWHVLTSPGKDVPILTLANTLGFHYAFDEKAGQFAHPAAIMILTPQGKIARVLTGIEFKPTDIRLAITEASEEKIGNIIDQILLLCFHYDPASGTYSLAVTRILRVLGIALVLGLGGFILVSLRREKRKKAGV